MFKLQRIRNKLLLTMLILTLLIFSVITATALFNMRRLERYASSSGLAFSRNAVKENKAAMIVEYRAELLKMAQAQALIIDLQIQRVFAELSAAVNLYKDIMDNPELANNPIFNQGIGNNPAITAEAANFRITPGKGNRENSAEQDNFRRMFNAFKFLCSGNRYLSTVGIASPSGLFIEYNETPMAPGQFDPRDRDWYKRAAAVPGRTIWYGPYDSIGEKRKVITFARAVTDTAGSLQAVLMFDLDINYISKDFIITEKTGGAAFLLNEDGRLIARESYETKELKWAENTEDERYFEQQVIAAMRQGQTGTRSAKLNNENFYLSYAPVKAIGWSVGITLPERNIIGIAKKAEAQIEASAATYQSFIDSYISGKRDLYIILGAIILSVIAITEYWFATRLTQPLRILRQGAEKLGAGNLGVRITTNTGDELEGLAESFNAMGENLKRHIDEIRRSIEARQKIINELEVAAKIQASMLPRKFPAFPDHPEFDIFAAMKPAREVGGDFYDFFMPGESSLCFCIGDVSGKGVPAALFMASAITLLRYEALSGKNPDDVLLNVNNALEQNNNSCMFATVFLGILDIHSGELRFSSAGHNPPLIRRGSGYEYLKVNKAIALGPLVQHPGVYKLEKTVIGPGDAIFLYTDGVTEATAPSGKFFGSAELQSVLNRAGTAAPRVLVETVINAVRDFEAGNAQSDDITLMSIKLS